MINKDILIQAIEAFNKKFEQMSDRCDKHPAPYAYLLEYYKMIQDWRKLQDVIEFNILPYTVEECKHENGFDHNSSVKGSVCRNCGEEM